MKMSRWRNNGYDDNHDDNVDDDDDNDIHRGMKQRTITFSTMK